MSDVPRRVVMSRRSGLALAEVLVSLVTVTVLMGGIASAIVLTSHALPDPDRPSDAALQGYRALDQMAAELRLATSVNVRSTQTIEFTVTDRDKDSVPETIRYHWSGRGGDPLTRNYNNSGAVPVVPKVHDLSFTYDYETVNSTHTLDVDSQGPEVVLASFNGWPGITPKGGDWPVSAKESLSEYFTINPPADAFELTFTRADVMMRQNSLLGQCKVAIHRTVSAKDSTPRPSPIAIGAPVLGINLPLLYLWTSFSFVPNAMTDLADTGYCLVIDGSVANAAWVQSFQSLSAPDNGMSMNWTDDVGVTWKSFATPHAQDLRYYVYGSYKSRAPQEVTESRSYLRSVSTLLRAAADKSSGVEATVYLLNRPQLSGPVLVVVEEMY